MTTQPDEMSDERRELLARLADADYRLTSAPSPPTEEE